MDTRTEMDAREYGAHVKAGGWRLGLLVARNVKLGAGQGARQPRRDHDEVAKVSASAFAKASGTSVDRVLRYLESWNDASATVAEIPHGDTLMPGVEVELDVETLPDWRDFYKAVSGGYNGGDDRAPSATDVRKVIEKASPQTLSAAMTDLGEETFEVVKEAATTEDVSRKLYRDRPKPTVETTTRRQAAKTAERLAANPSEAVAHVGALLGRGRAVTRQIAEEYRDFLALVEDEDWREHLRERVINYQADTNLALGEVLNGSFDDALARLVEEEVKS